MDPDSCLTRIHDALESLRRGNKEAREEAIEALRALATWLERGGFPPQKAFVPAD